jgi:hypothetical protein
MAEKRTTKKKASKREKTERRFLPSQTQTTKLALGGGMVGALVLGAGVYAQWIQEPPLGYSPYIVAAGALALGAALWFGESDAAPVRVGDAGIAIEKGAEISRVAWCDIERVSVSKAELVVKSDELTLTLPIKAHAHAVSWILSEGTRRVPDVMDVKRSVVDELPKPKDVESEVVPIEAVQVAGRHCAASDKPIAFEKDARLCPNCAEVYHKDHVPKKCATCEHELAGRSVPV